MQMVGGMRYKNISFISEKMSQPALYHQHPNMFNIKKIDFMSANVGQLIVKLKELPEDYTVSIMGAIEFYVHVNDEEKYVVLDETNLSEFYDENEFENWLEEHSNN